MIGLILMASLAAAQAVEKGYANHKKGEANAANAEQQYGIQSDNYYRTLNQSSARANQIDQQTVGAENDRTMKYREQLGAVRVALAENGASGTRAGTAQLREAGGKYGLDMQRLMSNNAAKRQALARKSAAARTNLKISAENTHDTFEAQNEALNRQTLGGYISAVSQVGGLAYKGTQNGPGPDDIKDPSASGPAGRHTQNSDIQKLF